MDYGTVGHILCTVTLALERYIFVSHEFIQM